MTSCCARAAATPRSIACNCGSRRPPPPNRFFFSPSNLGTAMSTDYVIPPAPQAAVKVAGSNKMFPVRRIWCVGRNYLEHIKEMGQGEREPPFFFAKPADAIVHDGGTVPYPPLTKDLHHEVEMVVALKSGGRNIPKEKALDCVWGYGVGVDLTRRDLQIASRNIKRP